MRHPLPACFAMAALAISLSTIQAQAADAAAPKTFKITLSPSYKVGQKYTLVSDASQTETSDVAMGPAGSPPQTQTQKSAMANHLEGEGEVLAVFPNGGAQKLAVTVKTLTATTDGQPAAGLPAAGAKIIAERVGDKKKFTVDGKDADPAVAKILDSVIDPDNEKRNDQTMFGTSTLQPVGGTWTPDPALMTQSLKEEMNLDVSNVSGTFKLDAVTGTGDTQVETISGNITVGNVTLPLPPGVTTDAASLTSQMSSQIPASTAQGTLKQSMSMTMKAAAHGEASGMQLKMNMGAEMKASAVETFH